MTQEQTKTNKTSKKSVRIKKDCTGKKNLSFFLEIIERLGLTLVELSKNAGRTSQNLYWSLKNDDTTLMSITYLLGSNGYLLIPDFKKDEEKPKVTNYEIKFDEGIEFNDSREKKNKFDNLQFIANSDRKLAFLANFILKHLTQTGESLGCFCEKIGMTYISLRNNLLSDDIRISVLNNISEVTGVKLIWSIKKVDPEKFKNDYEKWKETKKLKR